MPATNKNELLAVTETEFANLSELINSIEQNAALVKLDEDTSIKDIVAHRAHWIGLFLGWYKDGMAGKEVYFPAKGYKWNQLKLYNKALRKKQSKLTWKDAKRQFTTNHKKLLKFINTHSNTDLYSGAMKGAKNDWTPGRFAEAAGPSHYRSASKYIKKVVKDNALA